MLKKITGPRAITLIVVVAALAIAAFVAVSRAQAPTAPAVRIQVTVIQLKPDMMTTWEDLQKNGNPPPDPNSGKSTEQDHFQSFFAVQYTLFERYYIKFVGSHANFRYYDYAHSPSKDSFSTGQLGGRLRFMMLF